MREQLVGLGRVSDPFVLSVPKDHSPLLPFFILDSMIASTPLRNPLVEVCLDLGSSSASLGVSAAPREGWVFSTLAQNFSCFSWWASDPQAPCSYSEPSNAPGLGTVGFPAL